MVSGCGVTTKLTTVQLDVRLLQPCIGPVDVPQRELTKSEVVTFYNKNRDRLVACKGKHGELARQIAKLDAELK